MSLPLLDSGIIEIAADHVFAFITVDQGRVTADSKARLTDLPDRNRLFLVLPAESVLLSRRSIPPLNERRLRAALPGLVEDLVMGDIEGLHIAVDSGQGVERRVAIADRHLIEFWIELFRSAQFAIGGIWCEQLSIPFDPKGWSINLRDRIGLGGALIRIGPIETMIVAGLGLDRITMLTHAVHSAGAPARVAVYGAREDAAALRSWFYAQDIATKWRGDDALLAFLKRRGAEAPLNLLQGQFRPTEAGIFSTAQWKLAAAIVIAVLSIQTLGLLLTQGQLGDEKTRFDHASETLLRSAFPTTATVLDANLQMSQGLEALRKKRGAQSTLGFEELASVAGELLRTLPPNSCRAMSFDGGTLSLRLAAPSLLSSMAQTSLTRTAAEHGMTASYSSNGANEGEITLLLKPRPVT